MKTSPACLVKLQLGQMIHDVYRLDADVDD